ncbi:hypothetical protein EGT81_19670 [Alcaligenes faecalis]|uniref:hypothetical protein n=1 Tax=Alcaligenes faecalis TaxID=511 RepID=UPI000F665122|nr:hypothetical protein [Alcaligenes faecalis]RSE57654.1 hypothetical protein EGT81_19670 [Alcaligenes faecalis]
MSLTILFILLTSISAVTYLVMSSVVLLLKVQKIKRSSEIVSDERAAIKADARPFEVVSQNDAAMQMVATSVGNENLKPETQKPLTTLPSTLEEWREFDEPACLRRQGNFVLL